MAGRARLLLLVSIATLVFGACSSAASSPTPTPLPAATPTPPPTPSPTPEPTPRASNVLFRYTYAMQLLSAGQYNDAIAQFGIVLRFLPDLAKAYHGRGLAYYHEEQMDLALEDFTKSIELMPEFADAHTSRGMARINNGDVARGIDDLRNALTLYESEGDDENAQQLRMRLERLLP